MNTSTSYEELSSIVRMGEKQEVSLDAVPTRRLPADADVVDVIHRKHTGSKSLSDRQSVEFAEPGKWAGQTHWERQAKLAQIHLAPQSERMAERRIDLLQQSSLDQNDRRELTKIEWNLSILERSELGRLANQALESAARDEQLTVQVERVLNALDRG